MDIEFYKKLLKKIYEANLINDGLNDLYNGKIVDGDDVKLKIAYKYGFNCS